LELITSLHIRNVCMARNKMIQLKSRVSYNDYSGIPSYSIRLLPQLLLYSELFLSHCRHYFDEVSKRVLGLIRQRFSHHLLLFFKLY